MSSWFYKLRRKRSATSCGAIAGFVSEAAIHKPPPLPPKAPAVAPPCSPNRASYYVPSRDRERERRPLSPRPAKEDNPKLRDTQFPRSPQPSDIVFDVVPRRDDRFGGGVDTAMMLELKLRPILTKPAPRADDSSCGAASPTARVRRRRHAMSRRKPAAAAATPAETCRRSRRRRQIAGLRWLYESVVVEKDSAEPEEDFLASMAEMIAAHGVRSPRGLEDLLACYLALNAADHHRAIVAAFRRAWHLQHRAPAPTTRRERCSLHA